ncbi:hypothetical protein EYF80_010067 [Liparis tanakae]|uniref:Uncharacterized protein n=1 Tax=Liparis tanakae TaxID=230148 RepID=A0A4Z2IR80_9TELE|nr:hypothetical protein EYF80_010067 [Liparis tanakae]
MLKDVLPDGVQVADVRDVADVVGHGLDDDIAGREHQLVGAHLRNDHRSTTDCLGAADGSREKRQESSVTQQWNLTGQDAAVRSGSAQQASPGRVLTYPDAEPEERQPDAVSHAHGRKEPDLGRRGALVLDVADDLLGGLPLVHLPLDPLVKAAFLQGAIEAHQELNVAVEAGLGEGGQVAQHVVPLAPADPVRVEAPVEPVEAVLGVHQ